MSQSGRRYGILALTATTAMALLAGVATPSQAASTTRARPVVLSAKSDCPWATFCLWDYSGYTGTLWKWPYDSSDAGYWIYVGDGENDKTTALFNNRANATDIAKNFPTKSSTPQACLPGGTAISDLHNYYYFNNMSASANNSISSYRFRTGGC